MPTTYNGVGTHYYGKRNVTVRQGVCDSCHRMSSLTSYETTLFFVVLFVPLIPLGKKRIMDQCAACSRHYAIPLQKYIEQRDRDYAEADQKMAAATTPEQAMDALRIVNTYRDPGTINRLIADAEQRFPDSASLHRFVAETHRFMSQFAEAEASTARSLALSEDPDARESLAEFQFMRGDIDAGRATLEPILATPSPAPSRAVQWGVEALQRAGRHREALELINRVVIADAPADVAKAFGKLRATSERMLEHSLADPDKYEIEADGLVIRRKRVRFAKLKWAAAAALLLAFVYLGYAVYLGTSRRAFLINGSDFAYTATIDGRPYALQPHEVKPIRVGEGDIAMAISAPGYTGTPTTFHFAKSILRRPFDFDTLALNPDGLAPIFTGTVVYSAGGGNDPPETLHVGGVGYVLPDLDYPFENPPASVSVKSNQAPPRYQVAYVDTKGDPSRLIEHLVGEKDDRARGVAMNALAWPCTEAEQLVAAIYVLGDAEAVAALKPRVAIRPIELESHRAYQNLREKLGETAAVRQEYRAMLDADPANGTLMYLVGRTMDDDLPGAIDLYRKAQSTTPPEPMAYVGESYSLAAQGDFAGALVAIRHARQAMPNRDTIRETEWDLLMANGRPAEALKLFVGTPNTEGGDEFRRRVETLFAMNAQDQAVAMIGPRKAAIAKKYDEETAALDERLARGLVAYLAHREAEFAESCTSDQLPSLRFTAAICKRDIPAAEAVLAEDPDIEPTTAMVLFLAADAAGDREAAQRWLARSSERLRARGGSQTAAATWLSGEATPTERDLLNWNAPPTQKAVTAAAIAAARPSMRSICGKIVDRFGYSRTFPRELLAASRLKHS